MTVIAATRSKFSSLSKGIASPTPYTEHAYPQAANRLQNIQ